MRFSLLLVASLAAASVALASSLAQQMGSVPAFLHLQSKHATGTLSSHEKQQFVELGQKFHAKNPSVLNRLTGTNSDAEKLIDSLVRGYARHAKRSKSPDPSHEQGQLPTLIALNEQASKPDASAEAIQALVHQGLTMLSQGYTKSSLKKVLGTDSTGQKLLAKISEGRQDSNKRSFRNAQPAFSRARNSKFTKRG